MNCKIPRPHAARRMFCFPWAGGTPSWFTGLSGDITEDLEVFAFCPKGRENRYNEEPYKCMEELIDEIVEIIHDNYWDKPFVFFGHSMGTLVSLFIAFEMKKRYNREPECMILSSANAPNTPNVINRRPRPRNFASHDDIKKYIEKLGGNSVLNEHPELWDTFLPHYISDLTLVEELIYDLPEGAPPPLSCPIQLFDGVDDDREQFLDDWRRLTSATLTYRTLPGKHFYLMKPENTKKLINLFNMKFSSEYL